MHYPQTWGYESRIQPGRIFRERDDAIKHDLELAMQEISVKAAEITRGSKPYAAMKFLVDYIDSLPVAHDAAAE